MSTRTLTAGVQTAIQEMVVRPVVMVQLHFDSGVEYVHSRLGDLVYDSNTYQGVGDLGSITPIREGADLVADGVVLELSGVPSARVAQSLTTEYQGRAVELFIGFVDASEALIADPVGPFSYTMDVPELTLGAEGVVRVTCESRFVVWNRPNSKRYSDQDHQADHPQDSFFRFMESMVEKEILWPADPDALASRTNTNTNNGGGGGGSAGGDPTSEGFIDEGSGEGGADENAP